MGQHSAASFVHDDDGNLTDDGRYAYVWDAENRLICIERKLPRANGDRRLSFQYDYTCPWHAANAYAFSCGKAAAASQGCGRRVTKAVETYSGGAWQQTQNHYFIYDGWNVVEVVNSQTIQLMTQYTLDTRRDRVALGRQSVRRASRDTWGPDLSGSLQGAGGIGGLLASEWPQTTGESKKYWFLYDANGNVGQLLRYRTTGGESVTAAARYEYDPYGNTLAAQDMDALNDPGAAAANPFRFSTKWLDHEAATTNPAGAVGTVGLYYYGYRYYSPGLGRWISRDPIGEEGGNNLFAAMTNNAVCFYDVLGKYITGVLKTYGGHLYNAGDALLNVDSVIEKLTSVGSVAWGIGIPHAFGIRLEKSDPKGFFDVSAAVDAILANPQVDWVSFQYEFHLYENE